MENPKPTPSFEPLFVRNMIESTLRIGLLLILLLYTYEIIRPFTTPILWGAIIAIAAFPLVRWLQPKLGGHRGLACSLVTLVFIAALVAPAWTATDAAVGGLKKLSTGLASGELRIPPPSARVTISPPRAWSWSPSTTAWVRSVSSPTRS